MLLQPVTRGGPSGAPPPRARPARRPLLVASRKLVALLIVYASCSLQATHFEAAAAGVAPTIDYSHNMRVLKLPKSTKPGEIIYRLRGSDGDPNSQLHFGAAGIHGRALLDIVQVPGSWNEADVYLRARLDQAEESGSDQAASQIDPANPLYAAVYNLTIFVADASNKTTQVESTILVTNDEQLEDPDSDSGYATQAPAAPDEQNRFSFLSLGSSASSSSSQSHHSHQANDSAAVLRLPTLASMARVNSNQLSPFIRPKHVFEAPENGQPGESIGFLNVRESDKSDLPVRFELRGRGSDHFGIRYVFGPRGQSRAELVLTQPVDYERQNLFQLKVLALNAWTNAKYDTRNVAALDIVVAVGDVQDTAPQFKQLPHAIKLTNAMRPGDLVGRVHAEDGDYADQRPIGYALDAGSPLSSYFNIDKQSGEIRLARSLQELSLSQQNLVMNGLSNDPTSGSMLQLTVYATELPDATSYDHLWPPMFARAELPLLMVDLVNEPPQIIGGLLVDGGSVNSAPTLRAFVRELASGRQDGEGSSGGQSDSSEGGFEGASPSQLVQWYISKNHSNAAPSAEQDSNASRDSAGALHAQLLKASKGRPMVVDFGQGLNGTFELSLEGPDAHLFELEPSYAANKQSLFNLFVAPTANRSLFDFDAVNRATGGVADSPARAFQLEIVARDFGTPRLATRLKCLIDLVDVNDNAPQFDSTLYTFSLFENAQVGQILGSIRARDLDRQASAGGVVSTLQQRVRYASLSGRDSQLFRLDPDSGLITLEGTLDREKQDHYLLLAEARDINGLASNYTKILVNVLDVNDNAPVFSQPHYDAVLLPDGTFIQPLVVSATDADEPSSANSQVAYEIIAGNQNDLFAIDSLSGAIYPTGSGGGGGSGPSGGAAGRPIQVPSILSEPIVPFSAREPNKLQPDQHGKILPSPNLSEHEIEETTVPSGRQQQASSPLRVNWPRSLFQTRLQNGEPLQKTGFESVLSNLELIHQDGGGGREQDLAAEAASAAQTTPPLSAHSDPRQLQAAQAQRGLHSTLHSRDFPQTNPNGHQHFDASKVPPVTTLVVRAHDFGIPLRSATCKVNIYNQALYSRSLSVILNGTAEQLEQRRDLIERSFGALTGSRVQIDSIDALSDSSSISVARLKLAIPAGHSLIDLTDLSALMTAIDYRPASNCPTLQQLQQSNPDQFRHPVHYISTGDKIYPVHQAPLSSNSSATPLPGGIGSIGSGGLNAIFSDIASMDHASNLLERKLLFYIIIVGICILALLVIWMIYFCCREDQDQTRAKKVGSEKASRRKRAQDSLDESDLSRDMAAGKRGRHHKSKSSSQTHLIDGSLAKSASQLDLADQLDSNKTHAKSAIGAQHPVGNNLLKQQQLSIPSNIKPEHYSMYNGQVWFEQGGLVRPPNGGLSSVQRADGAPATPGQRRASSAPSTGGHSLDSGLHAIINGRASGLSPANSGVATPQRGQFFPNTIGYAENLAAIASPASAHSKEATNTPAGLDGPGQRTLFGKRSLVKSRGKVGPMTSGGSTNEAFDADLESGAGGMELTTPGGNGISREERQHRRRKSKPRSTSSSSRSDSTRTLDEEEEIDRESVLLDSDQELLGYDATRTPVIATRIRQKPDANLLVAPDSSATGSSSPAVTVINMGQANGAPEEEAPEAAREPAAVVVENGGESVGDTKQNGETSEQSAASLAREKRDGVPRDDDKEAPGAGGGRQVVESKVVASSKEDKAPAGSRKSVDLMSELSERLSGVNKLRGLRRQGASDDHDESRPRRPAENQVSDQAADETSRVSDGRKQSVTSVAVDIGTKLAPGDYKNEVATTSNGAAKGRRPLDKQQTSESLSCQSPSTLSDATTTTLGDENRLRDMKNGELLEKQSIFALTYNGLASNKLPS